MPRSLVILALAALTLSARAQSPTSNFENDGSCKDVPGFDQADVTRLDSDHVTLPDAPQPQRRTSP